jgi:alkylation response protein AidB-like acyl-CoA dehydrogenase
VRFAFTDDQLLFRDAVRDFLAKECPADLVRASWETDTGRSDDLWRGLAELGVVGLTAPEDQGGLGMSELDLVLLLEEAGRAALPEPLLETTAVVIPLLADVLAGAAGPAAVEGLPGQLAAEWLPRLASGEARATVSLAGEPLVPDAHVADLVVLGRGDRLFAVPGTSVGLEAQPSIDGARRLYSVTWDESVEVPLASGDAAWPLINATFDRGALATAAELVGLADHLLAVTVDYVAQREQFGVPVGSFQAVKHHLADALLQLEFAKPLVHRAAYAMAGGLDTASRDVSMAKAQASDAAALVVRHALQCHGAIAYTVEYDLHLWMKRVWALAAAWGDAAYHRERVAVSVLGPPPAH